MDRAAELSQIYREAIALTERQTKAIQAGDWEQLLALIDQREVCITRAEALFKHSGPLANRAELTELLRSLQARDAENQALIQEQQAELRSEMQSLNHSKTALNGYLEAFSDVYTPSFVNQDQ